MTPEQAEILVRIDERTAAIKETLSRHETSISDTNVRVGELEKFRSRARGVTKGAAAVLTVAGAVVTFVAKAKGMF